MLDFILVMVFALLFFWIILSYASSKTKENEWKKIKVQPGDIRYFIDGEYHPWTEEAPERCRAKVIDVKDGWVKYSIGIMHSKEFTEKVYYKPLEHFVLTYKIKEKT